MTWGPWPELTSMVRTFADDGCVACHLCTLAWQTLLADA